MASISIKRPFSIFPALTNQTIAASKDPVVPSARRPRVTKVSATAKIARAEGRRAVHSLRTPVNLKEAATIQLTNGGLRK